MGAALPISILSSILCLAWRLFVCHEVVLSWCRVWILVSSYWHPRRQQSHHRIGYDGPICWGVSSGDVGQHDGPSHWLLLARVGPWVMGSTLLPRIVERAVLSDDVGCRFFDSRHKWSSHANAVQNGPTFGGLSRRPMSFGIRHCRPGMLGHHIGSCVSALTVIRSIIAVGS